MLRNANNTVCEYNKETNKNVCFTKSMKNKENIFTVSEVNRHLKNVIESSIPTLYVEGEIANFTRHSSGHIYFSMKDERSSLRCVFFRSYNAHLQFNPKVGDQVICAGKLSVFERAGNYQLNVTRMFPSGIGELQIKFEELKRKLSEEGLFDEQYKKSIPKFPESIGVVTSETGAAFQDIRNVISRRYPCEIYLYPATVQGEKATPEIIAGIRFFNEQKKVDVLIIGRGGGSQEDLFCFNDEKLARIIFASEIPLISAVGHEIDFTISDFVADMRAPTPSAAAELAVPDRIELLNKIKNIANRITRSSLENINSHKLFLLDLENRLSRHHPKFLLQSFQQRLDGSALKLKHLFRQKINKHQNRLEILSRQLQELSPYEAMKRGYSLVRQRNKILNSVNKLDKKELLEIALSDGSCNCEIREISAAKNTNEHEEI